MKHNERCRYCKCFIPKVKMGIFTSMLCRKCEPFSDGKLKATFDSLTVDGILIAALSSKQTNTNTLFLDIENKTKA